MKILWLIVSSSPRLQHILKHNEIAKNVFTRGMELSKHIL